MSNSALTSYIQKAREKKLSNEEIKKNLTESGWDESVVANALDETDDLLVPPPPPSSQTVTAQSKSHHSMWDAFEHVLLFISLFVMSTAFSLLLHNLIDQSFQSTSRGYDGSYRYSYQSNYYDDVIIWCIAALLVSTPIFMGLFINLLHRTKQNPAIRELRERKVLTYGALVITFIIIIYKVITIIYSLLSGNITLNIFLHFLITCGVSGGIFAYYFFQVKEDRSLHE